MVALVQQSHPTQASNIISDKLVGAGIVKSALVQQSHPTQASNIISDKLLVQVS